MFGTLPGIIRLDCGVLAGPPRYTVQVRSARDSVAMPYQANPSSRFAAARCEQCELVGATIPGVQNAQIRALSGRPGPSYYTQKPELADVE